MAHAARLDENSVSWTPRKRDTAVWDILPHPCALLRQQDYNFHMHRLRTTRTFYGWIVLLAFLFGLFAPALSHAMARVSDQQATAWMSEICSASGARHVMILDDGAAQSTPSVPDMSHCDLCCPQQHASLAPPPQADAALLHARERAPYPPLFYQAPRAQHTWTPAQSRGPPASLS